MSLIVLSSGQDKYDQTSYLQLDDRQLPTSATSPGLQDPAAFENNINPTLTIPPNSEVALKNIGFYRTSLIRVGKNESFGMYIGEPLYQSKRTRSSVIPAKSLKEVGKMVIPVPLEPGTYTTLTFADMMETLLNRFISYPPYFNNIWVLPAETQGDGTYELGWVWNFDCGDSNTKTSYHTSMGQDNAWELLSGDYTWNGGTNSYISDAGASFDTNTAILEGRPFDIIGGTMTWDVSAATQGWRIGFTRPTAADGREQPHSFQDNGEGWWDYMIEYSRRGADASHTIRMYHSVIVDGVFQMREVEYYNNADASFTPNLSDVGYTTSLAHMYSGTPVTGAILGADPSHISIMISGEDTTVTLTAGGTSYILTDSRLCVVGNAVLEAKTPTRNRFFKPLGTNTHALYPKISLAGAVGTTTATLTKYDGILSADYLYPQTALSPDGFVTSGNSFWGRSQQAGVMNQREISDINDRADPYNSSLTTAQKQYVGLDGPTGIALPNPPVREGEGLIPATATGDGFGVAYGTGMITIPSVSGIGNSNVAGVYSSATSDVSALFGFLEDPQVFNTRTGVTYSVAGGDETPPDQNVGGFYGWYVGSSAHIQPQRDNYFIRCPTLTHQSYNMGKGIPSKIIASFPNENTATLSDWGNMFYEPNEMTYLALNNPSEITYNDLRIEIVDKNEELVKDLGKTTIVVLHFRKQLAQKG